MASRPLISIITVNRDNAQGLRKTLESVANQSFRDFEHLVIDGGSADASRDVIRDFEGGLAYWCSERDAGIYQAMNKGIAHARGQYCLFLNSGDHLKNEGSLALAAPWLRGEQLVYFDIEIAEGSTASPRCKQYPARLSLSYFAVDTLPHPATFIDATLFAAHGPYDESLRIVSDWKAFMLWVCKHGCSYRAVPEILSVFYLDGISSDPKAATARRAERETTLRQEFPAIYQDIVDGLAALRLLSRLRENTVLRMLQWLGLLDRF